MLNTLTEIRIIIKDCRIDPHCYWCQGQGFVNHKVELGWLPCVCVYKLSKEEENG